MMKTLLLGMLGLAPLFGAVIGQTDDFEDGTTQDWHINSLGLGGGTGPQNIASGGPAGADDNYMLLTALGGSGGGSRLVANNFFAQWAGNYTGAGISQISVDLRNFNSVDLYVRLFLENPLGGPPTDTAYTDAFFLPAGSDWMHAVFHIGPYSLNVQSGDAATLLSNVTGLRIYHGTAGPHPPEAIVGTLGVDNITAQTPEPSTMVLAGLGLLGMAIRRLRRA